MTPESDAAEFIAWATLDGLAPREVCLALGMPDGTTPAGWGAVLDAVAARAWEMEQAARQERRRVRKPMIRRRG